MIFIPIFLTLAHYQAEEACDIDFYWTQFQRNSIEKYCPKWVNWKDITFESTQLGKGVSGTVMKAYVLHDTVAIKVFSHISHFVKELEILSLHSNTHIPQLRGVTCNPVTQKYAIIREFIDSDLKHYLANHTSNSNVFLRIAIARQLAFALSQLHFGNHSHIHGDMKPENCLIGSGTVSIIDFATSIPIDINGMGQFDRQSLTVGYCAPEMMLGANSCLISPAVDIFALSMILWELFFQTSLPRYNLQLGQRPSLAIGERQTVLLNAPQETKEALIQLITDCWNEDPQMRPNALDLVVRFNDMLFFGVSRLPQYLRDFVTTLTEDHKCEIKWQQLVSSVLKCWNIESNDGNIMKFSQRRNQRTGNSTRVASSDRGAAVSNNNQTMLMEIFDFLDVLFNTPAEYIFIPYIISHLACFHDASCNSMPLLLYNMKEICSKPWFFGHTLAENTLAASNHYQIDTFQQIPFQTQHMQQQYPTPPMTPISPSSSFSSFSSSSASPSSSSSFSSTIPNFQVSDPVRALLRFSSNCQVGTPFTVCYPNSVNPTVIDKISVFHDLENSSYILNGSNDPCYYLSDILLHALRLPRNSRIPTSSQRTPFAHLVEKKVQIDSITSRYTLQNNTPADGTRSSSQLFGSDSQNSMETC